MWISRPDVKSLFVNQWLNLQNQILILRGARQVGKTSLVQSILDEKNDFPQIHVNLMHEKSNHNKFGRDFFGSSPTGEDFLQNLKLQLGPFDQLKNPALIFIDEVDYFPVVLESIQNLATYSKSLKFVLTGSNLENIPVQNVATGRKNYFDLYPITFEEFLLATDHSQEKSQLDLQTISHFTITEFLHNKISKPFETYLRLGGMPKILSTYFETPHQTKKIAKVVSDLVFSIEENVKTILGEKSKYYEYLDILRTMAILSLNTLKFSRLQVQHGGAKEAKKIVSKTVGARIAHKIRLIESESDLSKYILFDSGIVNYLLKGSDLLNVNISPKTRAVLLETFVGNSIIGQQVSRDDVFYWKSKNKAEIEFVCRSPKTFGVDVKSTADSRIVSLNSYALFERAAQIIIKIADEFPSYKPDYLAKLPNHPDKKIIPLLTIPHYMTGQIYRLLEE